MTYRAGLIATLLAAVLPIPLRAGQAQEPGPPRAATQRDTVVELAPFWVGVEPVPFTLTLNMALVRADTMDDPPSRAATVSWRTVDGRVASLPVKVKTHGRWRLTHCEFPPLSVNFGEGTTAGTPFEGLAKARLTSYCRNTAAYEEYVLQELQLYRIYQLLTPYSHAARALRVTYVDSASGKTRATRYAFFIEDRDALAVRLHGAWMKAEGALASDLGSYYNALVGVFEYMIGNTDFLVSALHNVSLLGTATGEIVPVAFDFDYAGAVNTAYAVPSPVLRIGSVRQRLFRGSCAEAADFQRVFALFGDRRRAIYALYDDPVGKLVRWDVVKDTRKYFDEFYRVIGDSALARMEILNRCVK